MSSFKEYMNKALNEEIKSLNKKSEKIKIDLNESSLNKYIKKYKNILNEEETASEKEEDNYLDEEGADTENETDNMTDSDEEDDSDEDYEKDEDEEAMASSCPIPTRDQTVNIENRQKAIDEFNYGPEDVTASNEDFWEEKKTKFMVTTVELAKEKKCGNCAAFSLKTAMLKCLDDGIDKEIDAEDKWDADKENRGYCDFLDFKCHAQRTCDSWVEGGPLKDQQ